ncbi:imidazole glycerol phosphate synthase subunit HisH [Exiguobacterium flavidum]|uniref:imidazole glycerol phosphate synthase subunit HisH n=1 Tax=Exiguobacterium flavidum TaxID=2184695 RepID=UPI000DF847EC|nr:imidazole glycerol phosphate synthase subunit HisH [Exiguobacterium flavidum]
MIAIVDYGVGNIANIERALKQVGEAVIVTSDRELLEQAEALVLPGVGAYRPAMARLEETGLVDFLKEQAKKKPFLGICLGMQLLFESSAEDGRTEGLGILPGTVEKLPETVRLPHMGWHKLKQHQEAVYFVHSYGAVCPEEIIVDAVDYGRTVPAIVRKGTVTGMQFHPEKSGEAGLELLREWRANT